VEGRLSPRDLRVRNYNSKNDECQWRDANYPIVFVNKTNLDKYVTPTLAPAAELHYLRHVRLNKN
jgi:hypothetical protein